tara:strand:+ start:2188 stop:2499 length:312 start_codon:yes stop_codon:yes gene_type:complete
MIKELIKEAYKKDLILLVKNPENDAWYYTWMCDLQKWLRDEHSIDNLNIYPYYSDSLLQGYKPFRGLLSMDNLYKFNKAETFKTYELALEKGLIEALKTLDNA